MTAAKNKKNNNKMKSPGPVPDPNTEGNATDPVNEGEETAPEIIPEAEPKKKLDLSKRDPAMDILRCIACFGVLSVHFFLHNGFYQTTINNRRMYLMVYMRSFFMYCVPLFILLTGYLMCHKKPERAYYGKLGKTLYTYVAAVLFGLYAFPKLYDVMKNAFDLPERLIEENSIPHTITKILSFDMAYSWYIEMYIGLFLMIPFLNILYNNIKTKKTKKLLIFTMLLLTALPAVLNVYNFKETGWFSDPAGLDPTGKQYPMHKLVPGFWTILYPVTYYFIGCYLREYGLKIKTWLNALLILAAAGVIGLYNLWRSRWYVFQWGAWADWNSLFNVVLAVLIFVFFKNLKYDKMPNFLKWCFMKLSGLTLGIYMISWSVDRLFYPVLLKNEPVMQRRLEHYFLIVPMVFICSAVVSYIINKLWLLIQLIAAAVKKKLRDRDAAVQ